MNTGGLGGCMTYDPPGELPKKLINKNAIKQKNNVPLQILFKKYGPLLDHL
jgi:hypothetical protein